MALQTEIKVAPDSSTLADWAAGEFVTLAGQALQAGSRFSVALEGGSTPRQLYARLIAARVDWKKIHFFWGDERCLPPDHKDSNYRMAQEALLSHIPVPLENIHRIPGELPGQDAAREYAEDLRLYFGSLTPRFDLVLLGLGSDGHTASLFPGKPTVNETTCWVAAVVHDIPPPPLVDRVTLTLPVLNAAAHVLFLVSGLGKAEILARVLHGPYQPDLLPAQAVKPVNGTLRWLVDEAAAAKLTPQQHQ
jgi:6-phosphogluconolactonase